MVGSLERTEVDEVRSSGSRVSWRATRLTRTMGVPQANAPGTRAYLPETEALLLSDERVATELACAFVESIVGDIAGSNAVWRCCRWVRATG